MTALPSAGALLFDETTLTLTQIGPGGGVVGTENLGIYRPQQIRNNAMLGIDSFGAISLVSTPSFQDRTIAPARTGQGNTNQPLLMTFAPLRIYSAENDPVFPHPFSAQDAKRRILTAIGTRARLE